jgi:hypothetical protein
MESELRIQALNVEKTDPNESTPRLSGGREGVDQGSVCTVA